MAFFAIKKKKELQKLKKDYASCISFKNKLFLVNQDVLRYQTSTNQHKTANLS